MSSISSNSQTGEWQSRGETHLPPRGISRHPPQTARQINEMQTQIGNYNNDDILECVDVWKFIRNYCPSNVASFEKLRDLGKTIATELEAYFPDNDEPVAVGEPGDADEERQQQQQVEQEKVEDDNINWTTPPEGKRDESRIFNEYVMICDKIKTHCIADGLCHDNVICSVADGTLVSQTFGSDFNIGGCFVKEATVIENGIVDKELETTDVLVVFECQQENNSDAVRNNRLKVLSAVACVLLDDVRRKFMYAINVEDKWMTLWYFSRDHCVRTTFHWWKDKTAMIYVFLSFMCAAEEDLGFDPRIHLLPTSENHKELGRRYIYELEDDTHTKHYYRTEKCIVESHGMRIIGRKTRVCKVVEVESKSDDAEYEDRPRKVLKDTWMNSESKTEGEIQKQLFTDIQRFVKSSVDIQHSLLEAWVEDGEFESDIADYLDGGKGKAKKDFRELFLCIKLESTGSPLRSIHTEYLRVPERATFYSSSHNAMSSSTSNISSSTPGQSSSNLAHRYPTKKRTFIIFDEFCQPIDALPTVGEVFKVLKRTVIALLLMYGGNWVHRDISAGNVMASWNPTTKEWESKLGDLEYARVFTGQEESRKSKTGTVYFMAAEILRNDYFLREQVSDADLASWASIVKQLKRHFPPINKVQPPSNNVVHNFYHDVESIFWIMYWVVTCCVGHSPSQRYVARVFSHEMKPNPYRDMTLAKEIPTKFTDALHPRLKNLVPKLELLRFHLWRNIAARQLSKKPLYSHVHLAVFTILDQICDIKQNWYNTPLQTSRSAHFSVPQTQPREVVSGSQPSRVAKRGREQDEGNEAEPAKRRSMDAVGISQEVER